MGIVSERGVIVRAPTSLNKRCASFHPFAMSAPRECVVETCTDGTVLACDPIQLIRTYVPGNGSGVFNVVLR